MEDVDILYGHLAYLTAICSIYFMFTSYIFFRLGIIFPVLVYCTKKNLATLGPTVAAGPDDTEILTFARQAKKKFGRQKKSGLLTAACAPFFRMLLVRISAADVATLGDRMCLRKQSPKTVFYKLYYDFFRRR
jgi:hypothetical protein